MPSMSISPIALGAVIKLRVLAEQAKEPADPAACQTEFFL